MSTLRVNKIYNVNGTGPVEFTRGINFPSNVHFEDTTTSATSLGLVINAATGIMTATSLTSNSIIASGIVSATTFQSTANSAALQLTNVPGFKTARAISLILIN